MLTTDELLMTTRSVRRRLDVTRPVADGLIRDCVTRALQAPAGSNVPRTRFVVVRDPGLRAAVAGIYREIYETVYRASPGYIGRVATSDPDAAGRQQAAARSADALPEKLADVPVIVIACLSGARVDGADGVASSPLLGGVLPTVWSFMLAARGRGLGTCWTTMHLAREREVAALLGIPYDRVQQVCLTPLAHTVGLDFRPARRPDAEEVIHWDRWDPAKPQPPVVDALLGRRVQPSGG